MDVVVPTCETSGGEVVTAESLPDNLDVLVSFRPVQWRRTAPEQCCADLHKAHTTEPI